MTVATVRVGARDIPADLEMLEPLPGLPGRSSYRLEPLDDAGVLFALRSQGDEPQARLFVVDPTAHFPDYAPELDATDGERALLVVVHPSTVGDAPTANLLAPLVVEVATGRTVQTVLDGDWPLRAPIS
ncbi:flagellar assembly protein FliW [Cellulomonas sp. PhB150]|uniref:flagellar assembly protein FliW n=1 Tax=Cellulomonas sp. PhB150 TaxID=2485188 RepID=UPI000F47C0DE|nr:flagellar assembly protein FliW [Cellulomonas sp. PhB150]ROS25797.1 flagellar assembly factor FliW [Cellulomonas sp. PhB150]